MQRIRRVVDVVYKKLHEDKWDNVWLLCGDEGIGKTNLGLHIIDDWHTKKYGKCAPTDIKSLSMDAKGYVNSLSTAKKGDIRDYDEGGELNNKRTMDRFNVMLTNAYRIIRNERIFSLITITDPFDINPFFLKRRARGLIYVFKRGRFGYWNRSRLRKLVDLNANMYRKSVWRVKPLFLDTFSIYKGPLAEPYQTMKDEFTAKYKKELYSMVFAEEKKDKDLELLARAKEMFGPMKTAELFKVSQKTVYNRLKQIEVEL
jgi:hypothetical protein